MAAAAGTPGGEPAQAAARHQAATAAG